MKPEGKDAKSSFQARQTMAKITNDEAELAIINRFREGYARRFGVTLTSLVHRDRPDFELTRADTGEKFGVEVTGAYQNSREAKIQYSAIEEWDRFQGSQDELIIGINRAIFSKVKASATYGYSGPLILAIWLGSLVFQAIRDIEFMRPQILIPPNGFKEIWLIARGQVEGANDIYQLQ